MIEFYCDNFDVPSFFCSAPIVTSHTRISLPLTLKQTIDFSGQHAEVTTVYSATTEALVLPCKPSIYLFISLCEMGCRVFRPLEGIINNRIKLEF